ncbi:MAG TPA: tetratricopeptide repeat protein [Blastocatellia bacterium]|nr:tetratricopeptide repeat protein [Blastocatellia bacterium]
MSYDKSFLTSYARAVSVVFLLIVVSVSPGSAQDPSGRPNPKGKKPPTKKTPPSKSEPQPLTVTLTVMTDPPASQVFVNGQAHGITNDDGKLQIEKLPLAHYSIEVRKEGYKARLQGFQAGLDSPTLVFKLEVDIDPYLKEFDSLMAAGKLAGPETPNALELIGKLTKQYGDRAEVVRLRGVLAARLAEAAAPVIAKTVPDSRALSRDELVRGLDGLINSLALRPDDNRTKAETAYLRGVLALRDGQGSGGAGDAGQGGGEGQAKNTATSARTEFESALKFEDSFAPARYHLGLLLIASGDHAGAETNLVRVTQAEPRWPSGHTALGAAYYGGAKFKEAIEEYRRAIAIDPKYAAAYAGLGLARWSKGEKDGVKDIERAAQMDPSIAVPHLNLGIVLSQSKSKKDLARADEELKKAIQLNGNNLEFPNRVAEQLLTDLQKKKK